MSTSGLWLRAELVPSAVSSGSGLAATVRVAGVLVLGTGAAFLPG